MILVSRFTLPNPMSDFQSVGSKRQRITETIPAPPPREMGDGMRHETPRTERREHVPHYLCDCGPIFKCRDPMTGEETWTHRSVTRQLN